jgi:hypothetical protein
MGQVATNLLGKTVIANNPQQNLSIKGTIEAISFSELTNDFIFLIHVPELKGKFVRVSYREISSVT